MKKLSINKTNVLDTVKACIIAVIISLLFVLVLALVVKIFTIDSKIIMPINQVIKIVSILGGCFFGFKSREKGAIKGGIVGIFYTLLSMLIFGIVENSISFSNFNWYDLLTGVVAGIISGILAVNIRKTT
ncbi:MAG: TIGR04086 family membrane protein [Bacillota bacterium]|jgi:putative membrane protein (TIGR04086 family)|nr:TIGR04086 family membrane protein [Bacillota bacterium]HHU43139.1 TIGR04086 family membrane protein [Clostridiales bacterium]